MSRGTPDSAAPPTASLTGLSPSAAGFPKTVLLLLKVAYAVLYPGMHAFRFGLLRVRSPLLTDSMFLSFPPVT